MGNNLASTYACLLLSSFKIFIVLFITTHEHILIKDPKDHVRSLVQICLIPDRIWASCFLKKMFIYLFKLFIYFGCSKS